jgi:Transposase family tnp2
MNYEKIDVCPNFYMLHYKDRANKDKCDECKEERYEPPSCKNSKKRVLKKVLRYLPITPRLQRLYMTRANAEHMRWHKEGAREKPDIMVHPADGEDRKQFDQKYPQFAVEICNVKLDLSTDGFMPYNSSAAPYSC